MESGHIFNVFPDETIMRGGIRSYDNETLEKVLSRIKTISHEVASAMECRAEVIINYGFP